MGDPVTKPPTRQRSNWFSRYRKEIGLTGLLIAAAGFIGTQVYDTKAQLKYLERDIAELKQDRKALSDQLRQQNEAFSTQLRQQHETFTGQLRQEHEAFAEFSRKMQMLDIWVHCRQLEELSGVVYKFDWASLSCIAVPGAKGKPQSSDPSAEP